MTSLFSIRVIKTRKFGVFDIFFQPVVSSTTTSPAASISTNVRYTPIDDALVDYGALSQNLPGHSQEKYYLTTAIAYTNGYPHIGHAYEFLTADTLVRYHRALGFDTYFLTGSDEHGQKVAASAQKSNLSPLDHCNKYVDGFKALNQRLSISYSYYQRTTEPYHELTAQILWQKCADKGDIYLSSYEGWYCEREETFVSDGDAEANNFLDPGSGLPLKRVTEESYFFKMSEYTDKLIAHIEKYPEFVEPENFRNNILGRLRKEGLRDLSISRTSFSWGIPVPDGFDKRHVMYVWFDALSNYLTGVHYFDASSPLQCYWPASKHVIGKDIIWFHCVIWPCILMSADIPLPGGVFSHGFVNGGDGRKMSKSLGNTVDPLDALDKFSSDTIRYYCCDSVTYGDDINFSESGLITKHNSELADILGNLVHRAMNLCKTYCDGVIPDTKHDPAFPLPFNMEALIDDITKDAKASAINRAVYKAMDAARATNGFLTEAEPWKLKGTDEKRRPAIVRTTLEAIYVFMHFLAPVIPQAAKKVFTMLNSAPIPAFSLNRNFYNLVPGTAVTLGPILFEKIVTDPTPTPTPVVGKNSKNSTKGGKSNEVEEDPNQHDFTKIDIRVGRISRVWCHEKAERLYCEEIDLGTLGIFRVASGLRQHYKLEELENRLVLVVCNLKESKMQGFESMGMVLAAKSKDGTKIELVSPPDTAEVGERVFIEKDGAKLNGNPLAPARVKKLKTWETVAANLHVDSQSTACWQDHPFMTTAGPCKVLSIVDSPVS